MDLLLRCTLLLALVGCRATAPPSPEAPSPEHAQLRQTIDALYVAFGFDAGGEPDWSTQERIYMQGATFVAPIRRGRTPVGVDTATFIDDFRAFARTGSYAGSGLYERILQTHIGVCGGVAHAFVLFEGHLPGEADARTRGMDSLQFVRDGEDWRLVSFTTQYESADTPLDLAQRSLP